jgi:hypothetical protein
VSRTLGESAARAVREWRDGVGKLQGLDPAELKTLRGGDLHTRTALAATVARDGLTATATRNRLNRVHLRDAMAMYALREADGRTRPLSMRVLRWVWRNWLEGVLLMVLLLAALGVRRALERPERVVIAARDLVPYQVIAPADVQQARKEAGFGTYGSLDDVIGLYPLRVINDGDAVRKDQMSRVRIADPAHLRDRRVLALSVAPQSAALAAPGSRVILLFTPTSEEETAQRVVRDVLVLDARATGDSSFVVAAVSLRDFDALGPLVARSTITVVREPVVPSP